MRELKMIIPKRGPFSNNYVRDWLIYHGSAFILGIFAIPFFWPVGAMIGVGIMVVALVAGIMNYLTDRSSEMYLHSMGN